MSALGQKRTSIALSAMSALCQKWALTRAIYGALLIPKPLVLRSLSRETNESLMLEEKARHGVGMWCGRIATSARIFTEQVGRACTALKMLGNF
jgi:hypothetical protein